MKDSRKKIIFFGPKPPPHMGPSLATEIILNSNLSKKFILIHLDTSDHRSLDYLNKYDLTNFYLGIKQYFQLIILIIKNKPDLVYLPHCQTTIGYLRDSVFILISKIFTVKVLCHLRGGNFKNWLDNSSWITKRYVRWIHSMVDGQIVLGTSLKKLFTNIVDSQKIFVIPNARGFGSTFNINKDKSKINLQNKRKIKVLFLSNLIASKGILDFLTAASILSSKMNNVQFVIAGAKRSDDVQTKINETIESFGEKVIYYAGQVSGDEKWKLYQTADIFVLPTYYPSEGHPWVIVEALAAGLPIISTDHAAINESVFDSYNGFIVSKKSPIELSERIQVLIEDDKLRSEFSKNSQIVYNKYFTEKKMVDNYNMAFESSINSG